MKFDSFIQSIDMGHCQDQQQREALFDLVLFLIVADGVITEQETQFMRKWLGTIEWSADVSKEEYYTSTLLKCYAAIKTNTVDDYLTHRAKLLIDIDMDCVFENKFQLRLFCIVDVFVLVKRVVFFF